MKFWTIDEFLHFRSLFKDEEYAYQLFFTVALFTGMRLGELLALNWEDINFAKKEINVSKTLFTLKGEVFINSPKTLAGERRISINSLFLKSIKKRYINSPKTLMYQLYRRPGSNRHALAGTGF
jgi:integrase